MHLKGEDVIRPIVFNAKPEFGSPLKNRPQDQKLRKY